jgi:uncharacterized protein YcaQ
MAAPACAAGIAGLRRFAVARSLFPPTTLPAALDRLGFVQADPIRAPARAQDLTLRHRVSGYRAGDLERQYEALGIEEDFFINYGFVTHAVQRLMHPRTRTATWSTRRGRLVAAVRAFVGQRGAAHPREIAERFAKGRVTNYWGGSSSTTTHLLDDMHYRGLLRVARRESGIRVYARHEHPAGPVGAAARRARIDALVDVAVATYAPVPGRTLAWLVGRLRVAVPQWRAEMPAALTRARARLSHARVDGVDWHWPAGEEVVADRVEDEVRFLAPFDPVVWDRTRFEAFWGWAYRFEAYTPVEKRKLGYYALPILWRDRAIGWANIAAAAGGLAVDDRYVAGRRPREKGFAGAFDREVARLQAFLYGRTIE